MITKQEPNWRKRLFKWFVEHDPILKRRVRILMHEMYLPDKNVKSINKNVLAMPYIKPNPIWYLKLLQRILRV